MKKTILIYFVFFIALSANSFSQDANLKAFYTLNLIRYVGWHNQALEGDFIIAVVGNSEVADQLRFCSNGKRFGHQNYLIKEFDKIEMVEACQVLFVGKRIKMPGGQKLLQNKAQETGSLIITESAGMINKGAAVNFVFGDKGLQFELNETNAGFADLQFSSRLASMAAAIVLK